VLQGLRKPLWYHPTMGRIWKYPELLFIGLVIAAPVPAAFLWSGSSLNFLVRLLLAAAAGFAVWMVIIVLIVRPRYRNY
jgi:hypothetical protein